MGSSQAFSDRFGPGSEAESSWLQNIFTFTQKHSSPAGPAHSDSDQSAAGASWESSVSSVEKIQESSCSSSSLPVSYRPSSVSESSSQQHSACVSNSSWSTNQHRAWAREAELSSPGQRASPRVNSSSIGWSREGRGGEWRSEDDGGSVRCESTRPSVSWMNRPVFSPHWNYIPHDTSGRDQDRGFLESIGSPVVSCARAEQGLAEGVGGAEPDGVVSVRKAAAHSRNRVKGQRVSVFGQVGSVCPSSEVSGSSFFFFSSVEDDQTVSVSVKDSRSWWSQCVCAGLSVCVTALRVCVLRGWRGNSVSCVTERSEIHTGYTHAHQHAHSEDTHSEGMKPLPPSASGHTHSEDRSMTDQEEAEPEEDPVQSAVRTKQSRVISYQGTVTEVVSEGAGLYVSDRKVGSCSAYQPSARRKSRPGDQVESFHVHFSYRPCPDSPPSMLCCCLRSSIRVTVFSKVGGASPDPGCPGDGVLPRLSSQKNRGVEQYSWTCHSTSQLRHSSVPAGPHQPPLPQCVCSSSWKLSETSWTQRGPGPRDIYSEMSDVPHRCPSAQYQVDASVPQLLSVSDLVQSLSSSCWSSVCLRSSSPPGGSSSSSSQSNSSSSWSCRTSTSAPQTGDSLRPRPSSSVGVLQSPSERSEFRQASQLRDDTASVGCVVTETTEEEDGGQRAAFNTAWIGCSVCVRRFTMVTERFLQSEFPSYQHSDQDRFIRHRTCRVYSQFSSDHLIILSPSVTMTTHSKMKGEEPGSDVAQSEEDEEGPGRKKGKPDEELSSSVTMEMGPEGGASQPCVSVVMRVMSKGGVAWRNEGKRRKDGEAGLESEFSAKASSIGPVVSWGRDPKNQPMMQREAEPEREDKVSSVFSGVSACWFPVLQPGSIYRLTAANTQDPSVSIGCRVTGQKGVELHTDSTLQVRSDWRFHTSTRPSVPLHTWIQAPPPPVSTVSQVLDCRSEVVTFQGSISERVSSMDRKEQNGHSGVRSTVCDQNGRSSCVYLDLSHAPYPPGSLPGNRVSSSGFLRKTSRSGSVYCSFSPVSCVTVTSSPGDACSLAPPPPPPSMHSASWAGSSCVQAQVKGHVVQVSMSQSQWSCSQCGSDYTQVCSSQCGSSSAGFQSKTKLVIDDGTAEAHVWLSGKPVQTSSGLADSQWEGLQRTSRVRGPVRVCPRGRSSGTDGDAEDVLLHFSSSLCCSDVVRRQLRLTCRRSANQSSEEVRRFSRGDREFSTRSPRPSQLTCTHSEPP